MQVDVSRNVIAASWVDIQYSEDDREPTPFEDYILPSGATRVPDEAPKFPRFFHFPSPVACSASLWRQVLNVGLGTWTVYCVTGFMHHLLT